MRLVGRGRGSEVESNVWCGVVWCVCGLWCACMGVGGGGCDGSSGVTGYRYRSAPDPFIWDANDVPELG